MASGSRWKPAYETLMDIYANSMKRFASRDLFGEKKNGAWQWTTYASFGQQVEDLRAGLAQLGVSHGDRVAVIANNRTEWAVAAYATYGLGAAYVPMYEAQNDKEWGYIIRDCDAKVVFLPDDKFADRLAKHRDKLPKLEHVIRFAGGADDKDTYASLLKRGAETPAPVTHPKPSDLAGLIYTSGTTGNPKGVQLSHSNLAYNVSAIHECFPMSNEDRSLSILPWAHSFGQTVELHGLFSMGASMGIAESPDKIMDNLAEVRPTLLFSVPRIFNRIYDGLQKRVAADTPVRRALFHRAIQIASERKALASQGRASIVIDVQYALLDRLVSAKVRERFGGRLKYAFSGGAAISREVAEFIDNLGIMVYEGYGLTETSPIFTANYPGNRKIGSVGRPIPGVRVDIDKSVNPSDDPRQGEIIAHGHNVMMGYLKLPEENEKVFTGDGGFRTGDLGYLDDDGYLYITGRVKEQYKLENGKYVVPVPIEQALSLSPLIANVMVHGDNKPFNIAVIYPDMKALTAWAQNRGLKTDSMPELFKHPDVQRLYAEQITEFGKSVKGYERPQRFILISEDFKTENDMLTPSLKIKRRNVLKAYGESIEQLYRDAAASGGARAA